MGTFLKLLDVWPVLAKSGQMIDSLLMVCHDWSWWHDSWGTKQVWHIMFVPHGSPVLAWGWIHIGVYWLFWWAWALDNICREFLYNLQIRQRNNRPNTTYLEGLVLCGTWAWDCKCCHGNGNVMKLHHCYGHITPFVACWLVKNGLVKAMHKLIAKIWEGKQSKEVGALTWSDIWGSTPVEMLRGRRYYVTFTDNHSCLVYLCTLCWKSKTFTAYQRFKAWLDHQLMVKICMLHSNWGGKYLSNKFILYLKWQGTAQCLTVHNTPQHNGVAEQLNWTIMKCVWALLHVSGLLKFLWGEAAHYIIWLKNRTPTKVLDGLTLYEVTFGWKPDLSQVHEWGSKVYVKTKWKNKLEGQVNKVRWMGINDKLKNAYQVWNRLLPLSITSIGDLWSVALRGRKKEHTQAMPYLLM